MKYLDQITFLQRIGSLSLTVFVQDLAQKFAQFSIFARKFCKDPWKFACFVTFGCKWACFLIWKRWKIENLVHIDSPYSVQGSFVEPKFRLMLHFFLPCSTPMRLQLRLWVRPNSVSFFNKNLKKSLHFLKTLFVFMTNSNRRHKKSYIKSYTIR